MPDHCTYCGKVWAYCECGKPNRNPSQVEPQPVVSHNCLVQGCEENHPEGQYHVDVTKARERRPLQPLAVEGGYRDPDLQRAADQAARLVRRTDTEASRWIEQHQAMIDALDRQSESHVVRKFETGATRDSDDGKYDYEGFLSPRVLEAFAKYMHVHRIQSDGSLRDSDNWQKGIPREQYLKSLLRHVMDLWLIGREQGKNFTVRPNGEVVTEEDALGGILFNAQGYWHELLKGS